MAGKRQATSDLNHDNWDREEDPEERGIFRTATDAELKNRVIKKATRKIVPGTSCANGSGTKSVFSSFAGFGKSTADDTTPTSFSFLNKIPAVVAVTSVVSSSTKTVTAAPKFLFGVSSAAPTTISNSPQSSKTLFSPGSSADNPATSAARSVATCESLEYYKNLSGLNQAVCEWIKTHVDKNPICILSPIFKDYEKYLEKLKNENKKEETGVSVVTEAPNVAKTTASGANMGNFKFSISNSSNAVSPNCDSALKTNGFSFEMKKPEDTSLVKPSVTPGFSFGLNPSTVSSTAATSTTPSTSFSFGSQSSSTNESGAPPKTFSFTPGGSPFTFGNIKPPDVSENTASGGDPNEEDEEPPKNVFKQVVEDDAVYSKKCKVFVKKDGNFVDKGVGTLYLKPVQSSDKTQLLVRADTNLGNILINLILNSSIPTQRMGKNNVMMIGLPTPEVDKPTSMLLRVKTSNEADELLENIEKFKE